MSSGEQGSVTNWIGALKAGDVDAARPLWERYFDRLVLVARKKLVSSRRLGADEDEEDAALSAFGSFCEGIARGQFEELNDRDDLWRLLVVITVRKASAQAQRRRARKRGGDWSALNPSQTNEEGDVPVVEQLAGSEPTPEFAAMVAEEYRRLLDKLDDDTLRQVALWRMEGLTNDEIAERLGCARRTVARRLDLIRKAWRDEMSSIDPPQEPDALP